MSKTQAGVIAQPGLINVPVKDQPGPGVINYPTNIQDHQVTVKLREIIDHLNQTKTTVAQNQTDTAANATAIQGLPSSYLTTNDVNSQIYTGLRETGAITNYVVTLLRASGVTVPARLPPFIPPGG